MAVKNGLIFLATGDKHNFFLQRRSYTGDLKED